MIRFRFDGSIRESLSSRGSTPTERETVSTLPGSGNAAASLEWVDRFNRLRTLEPVRPPRCSGGGRGTARPRTTGREACPNPRGSPSSPRPRPRRQAYGTRRSPWRPLRLGRTLEAWRKPERPYPCHAAPDYTGRGARPGDAGGAVGRKRDALSLPLGVVHEVFPLCVLHRTAQVATPMRGGRPSGVSNALFLRFLVGPRQLPV